MDNYVIRGTNRLEGKVNISGAKNAALKLMAASIMASGTTVVNNIPNIKDVWTMVDVLKKLGMEVNFDDHNRLEIKSSSFLQHETPYELVRRMRASIIVLGPLLALLGKAKVAMPGGCNIGSRKVDMHIKGLELLGAKIETEYGYIKATTDGLKGAIIPLDFPSVGATENLVMAAVLAEGVTEIENAAREPEVVDLINFLNKMGAEIEGVGTSTIKIKGVKSLKGINYTVIPDRIEAGTYMIAAAITRGDILIKKAQASHLELVISKLRETGVSIKETKEGIRVKSLKRPIAADVATLPYPGFPTDMQAQMMALLSVANGTSVITENVFENRFIFVGVLNRMGSDIVTDGHHAIIRGVNQLSGAPVKAPDLRGGAALVLGALAAEGVTEISDVYHIDRGYENFEQKLRLLGADINRVSVEADAFDEM
ncbi:MAG: UDP-N-acetylglucosamine 1-carboxyvinyltransferase [Actinobacteria bacterium]|nr:UDP-N-acetylglucosamine 1-carboxyvinyltransferase [Actinomycetota bacterium]